MQIYVYRNQKEVGPYSKAMLLEGLDLGAFSPTEYARTEGMSEYKTLGELLKELETTGPASASNPARIKATPRAVPMPRAVRATIPPKKRPPILSGAIAIAVVAAGAYVAVSPNAAGVRNYLASVVAQFSKPKPKAIARAATPAPIPVVQEEPKTPEPPAPTPEVIPEPPQPPAFDPAKLAETPAAWPKTVHLLEVAPFPAVLNGKLVGSVRVPAGASVKLIKISGEELTLDYQGGQIVLPWYKTDLEEAAAETAKLAAAAPATPAPIPAPGTPAPAPSSAIASTAPTSSSAWMWKNAEPNYGGAKTTTVDVGSMLEYGVLDRALRSAKYQLTPEVKTAYLRLAKAKALREINNSRTYLPADFLAWIDSDPIVSETVYGARKDAAGVLCMLRSLELDLGRDTVRRDYTQLALAVAVVEAPNGAKANLSPRAPMKLTILGDPRKPVDTHAKNRQLDENDHIINFLEDHPEIEGENFGPNQLPPELKYDSKGVAIMDRDKGGSEKEVKKTKRKLFAADVIASKALQDEFNAYMAAHHQKARIDCGDRVLTPNQHEMVKGPYEDPIKKAYQMFRTAYEAKGRLPASRDPMATPAERCAFAIRNDSRFPDTEDGHKKWDRFPVKTAPWPTMTLFALNTDPLREREEIWQRFVNKGEAITYGEYIGGIAQQFDFQSARRLSPYAFSYQTFQMMMKDGGVCGTMANMSVRTHISLGSPACTAGQPGHCALIVFSKDKNAETFRCHGEQYATGEDNDTHPHGKWIFGDSDKVRDMAWHQSVAYAVNAGFQSYLDSMVALQIYKNLPKAAQKENGFNLLKSGIAANRYNLAIVETAAEAGDANNGLTQLGSMLSKSLADNGDKPGCPSKGLFNATVEEILQKGGATMNADGKEAKSGTASLFGKPQG